jgi:6-phosphogluconate dehydrogenase
MIGWPWVAASWPPAPEHMPRKEIGYVGLGKMGLNTVQRLIDHEWRVAAYDPDKDARQSAEAYGAVVGNSLADVVSALIAPRVVWLMVPHQKVDDVLNELVPHLEAGDTVIEGGNSFYIESARRAKELAAKNIRFLDVGVSGGPEGARRGACLMIGGSEDVYKQYTGLFSDLAVAGGYDYMGQAGAGHFVKMVHNGIEYGMMQAIGEGFEVLKTYPEELDVEKIVRLYNRGSVIESRLIGWLKKAYEEYGADLSPISGKVEHSGAGLWTVETAKEFNIPVPVIEASLQFREDSQARPSYTGQVVSALRNQFGGHEVKEKK